MNIRRVSEGSWLSLVDAGFVLEGLHFRFKKCQACLDE